MDKLKKMRRPYRTRLTKLINECKVALEAGTYSRETFRAKMKLLLETASNLNELDAKVRDQLIEDDTIDAEEVDKEFEECEKYRMDFLQLQEEIDSIINPNYPVPTSPVQSEAAVSSCSRGGGSKKNLKLPKIELGKFSGELKDWLGFWSQFKKIHEDEDLRGSEKFHYLRQYMEKGTTALKMVTSYPETDENYPKVVEALQAKFGDEDLLLQVYVRELLKLVINNVNSKDKIPLESLVLQLDSHLRSLETLKLEAADPATWLFPLVESSLPEEILLTWQRSPLSDKVGGIEEPKQTRLDILMEFLKKEVAIRNRIDLAQNGFQNKKSEKKNEKTDKKSKDDKVMTLTGFHVGDTCACVFCDKSHPSQECFTAMRMSLEDKKKRLAEKKACFACLKVGHWASKCRGKVMCPVCGRKHHAIMCNLSTNVPEKIQQQSSWMGPESAPVSKSADWTQTKTVTFDGDDAYSTATTKKAKNRNQDSFSPAIQHLTDCSNQVCTSLVKLMTILVDIHADGRKKTVRAFLDPGSQRSYILDSTAEELELESHGEERATHSMFAAIKTSTIVHKKYRVSLGMCGGGFKCEMKMRGSRKICNPIPRITRSSDLFYQLKKNRIYVNDVEENGNSYIPGIEILIGSDNYGSLLTGKIVQLDCGITAQETRLGWVLSGEDSRKEESRGSHENSVSMMLLTMTAMDAPIEDMWRLETIGIQDDVASKTAAEREAEAKEKFVSTISRCSDGRYRVKLPFLEDHPPLPTNKQVAVKRLHRTTIKLMNDGKFEQYDKLMKEWSTEFTEVVPPNSSTAHYIPHRPVFKESLTTPVRPVFDCSCKVGKHPSLNDCLQTGSNYVQLIPELLMRFREKKIAVTADIRKAFQMIEVHPDDRKFLRFLWWEDYQQQKVMEYQHARVVFGATCSPFILGAVLEHHLNHVPPPHDETAMRLLDGFYVDNYIGSEDTVEEYFEFREVATDLLSDAKMDLRMWMSNIDGLEDPATLTTSILGLKWNRKADCLYVPVCSIVKPEVLTKRALLSTVQKVFDPVGFLSPALIPMKLILQKSWINKKKWDEELPYDESLAFSKWFAEIRYLEAIKIPRLATNGSTDKKQWSLHTFTDASAVAYACIVYIRVETENKVDVQLLMSKARVAPVKSMTIPRLELMGCLIGSRVAATVKKALNLTDVDEYYWSDSSTALAWIKREYNHNVFVRNRVKEIRLKTDVNSWRHVPGVMNPADLPSRGCLPKELVESRWWEGPIWLKLPQQSWPAASEEEDEGAIMAEVKKNVPLMTSCFLDNAEVDYTYEQTVRIMGWVKRAIHNFKNFNCRNLKRKLSSDELRVAELAVWKEVQGESFTDMKNLEGLPVFRSESGLLRLKTRLLFREDLASFKTPIVVPSKHPLVQKVIMETHLKNCHAGVNFLMANLREKFWILKTRRTIKGVLNKCLRCRRYAAKHAVVEEGPLPNDRIKDAAVFEATGVDLAGPLILKNRQKVWIVIYTCAVYRAVFLDLVSSLTTRVFIKSLKKFVEKHGRPRVIYSDNCTNFVGANNLFKMLNWKEIIEAEEVKPILWKFNPPSAAWWGGWWERLIRTVKDLLRKTIGKGVVNNSELYILLKRIEDVMNHRPLTYVSEDPNELEPLTPAMFLNAPRRMSFPEAELTETDGLRIRNKYIATLKEELKKRFRSEYLALLVSKSRKPTRDLKEGELVFVGSDMHHKLEWKLGRIMEFIPGKDGLNRLARVKTESREMLVPVQRLYPLEVEDPFPEEFKTKSGRAVKIPNRLGVNIV